MRTVLAHAIVKGIYYPWRLLEKLLGRSFGCAHHSHHTIRDVFRALADHWQVSVIYPNVADPTRSIRMRLDLCETTQLAYFRDAGAYDEPWLKVFARAMKYADCFVDVGAHFGLHAMTIAQVCPLKRVIAIEAAPENVSKLREHLAMNGLESVEVRACAVASSGPEAVYYRNPLNDGGGGLAPVQEYRSGERRVRVTEYLDAHPEFVPTVQVPALRIDALVKESCVLKIDVEGTELDVLRSAETLLATRRIPAMVVEVWSGHLDDIIRYLDQFDIDCFRAGVDEPLQVGDLIDRRIINVLCLRRDLPDRRSFVRLAS